MIITLHGSSATLNSQGAYDFTNHIKSSMDIEPNSSIALVNATIERLSELIIGTDNGTIQMELDDHNPIMQDIHIPSGIYNTASLADILQSVMNTKFNQHGYTFYVSFDKKDDKFKINWHEGSAKGALGKPKFENLQADLTQSIANSGTKLSLANGHPANTWAMARRNDSIPDYQSFPEPKTAQSSLYILTKLNVPNDSQVIIGVVLMVAIFFLAKIMMGILTSMSSNGGSFLSNLSIIFTNS